MKILTFFDFGVKRRSHVGEVHPRTLGPVLSVEKKHCRETHSSNSGMMHQIHVGSNSVWHCLLKDNSLNEWTTSVLFRLKAHMHPAPGCVLHKCVLCWQNIMSKAMLWQCNNLNKNEMKMKKKNSFYTAVLFQSNSQHPESHACKTCYI